jgi:DNA-binding response OmpR family regulator
MVVATAALVRFPRSRRLPICRNRGDILERGVCAWGFLRHSRPIMTRVLVVEDDLSVGAAIRMTLDREGYETVHAIDARVGIKTFESSRFDFALIDLFLPDIDGLKTIAEFRRGVPTMPILAMSGFIFRGSMDSNLDYFTMAIEAGATGCLRKPFSPHQLLAAVHASLASVLSAGPP